MKHIYKLVEDVARTAAPNRRYSLADWEALLRTEAASRGIELRDDPDDVRTTWKFIATWCPSAYRRVLVHEILRGRDIEIDPPGGWKPIIAEYVQGHGIDLDNYGSLNTMVSAITSIRQRRNSLTTPRRGDDVMTGPARIPGGRRRRIIDPRGL